MLQAIQTQTVDILLAIVLLLGGLVGTQIGARMGTRIPGDQLRILLALLIVGVWLKLVYDVTSVPADTYSVEVLAKQ